MYSLIIGNQGGGWGWVIMDASNRASTGALTGHRRGGVECHKGSVRSCSDRRVCAVSCSASTSPAAKGGPDSPHAHFGLLPLTDELIKIRFTAGSHFTRPHLIQITASVGGGGSLSGLPIFKHFLLPIFTAFSLSSQVCQKSCRCDSSFLCHTFKYLSYSMCTTGRGGRHPRWDMFNQGDYRCGDNPER